MPPEDINFGRTGRSIAEEIACLTRELRTGREQREQDLATKSDLKAMEARILAALQGASDADLKKLSADLKASTDPLAAAVAKDQAR